MAGWAGGEGRLQGDLKRLCACRAYKNHRPSIFGFVFSSLSSSLKRHLSPKLQSVISFSFFVWAGFLISLYLISLGFPTVNNHQSTSIKSQKQTQEKELLYHLFSHLERIIKDLSTTIIHHALQHSLPLGSGRAGSCLSHRPPTERPKLHRQPSCSCPSCERRW